MNPNRILGPSSPFYVDPEETLVHYWFLLGVVMDRKEIFKLKENKAKEEFYK